MGKTSVWESVCPLFTGCLTPSLSFLGDTQVQEVWRNRGTFNIKMSIADFQKYHSKVILIHEFQYRRLSSVLVVMC